MSGLTRPARNGFLAAVKVFRDHVQIVGAFFNSFGKTVGAKLSLKTIMPAFFVLSLDLGSLGVNVANYFEVAFIVLIVAVILAFCGFCVFMRMTAPDAIREGHEVELWDKRKENKKWTIGSVQIFFRLLAAAYIELVRQIVMVLSCGEDLRDGLYDADKDTLKARKDYNCGDSKDYDKYTSLAVVMLIIFGIGSPLAMMSAIRRNKPTGSPEHRDKRYDHQGNLVDYTDEMYRRDLAREDQQACPYVFLYDDYKRTRSYYELEMMFFKSVVAICGVLLAEKLLALGFVNLGIVVAVSYFAFKNTPFLDPMVSAACMAGHVAELSVQTLLILSVGIYKEHDNSSAGSKVLAASVFIATGVGIVVNIFVWMITNDKTRPYINSCLGRLTFSSVVTTTVGTARVMLAVWDPLEEARQRAWKMFWDTFVSKELGEEGIKRLQEEDSLALKLGVQRLHESVVGSADQAVMGIRTSVLSIEGVDVYWKYTSNRTCSYFGKMYVVPFPFHAVVVFDDTDDYTFLHAPRDLNQLATYNLADRDILVKKDAREKMRGMEGRRIRYTYDHWVTRRVEDGYSVYTDSSGNQQRRTEYSNISVHLFYTSGIFAIARRFNNKWSCGFRPSVHLDDGQGSARKPRTGEMAYFKNERYTLNAAELGIDHSMNPANFAKLFNENSENVVGWQKAWLTQVANYRQSLATTRHNKNCILRDEFWYAIYNEPLSSVHTLRQRILQFEKNPKITMIALEPNMQYDLEQLCLDIIHLEDPKEAFWYTFWHDVWVNNSDIKPIGKNPDFFNPQQRASIGHRSMSRFELEAELAQCLGPKTATRLFSSTLLDLLYEQLRIHGKDEDGARRSSVANRGSYIKGVDDADTLPDLEQPSAVERVQPVVIPDASVLPTAPAQSGAEVEVEVDTGAVEEKQGEHDDQKQKQEEAVDAGLLTHAS